MQPAIEWRVSRLNRAIVLLFAIVTAGIIPDSRACGGDRRDPAGGERGAALVQPAGEVATDQRTSGCFLRDPAGTDTLDRPPGKATRIGPVPNRLDGPRLTYPPRLLSMWTEGWVDVQCDLDESGRPSNCAVIASSDVRDKVFAGTALAYVSSGRYAPATHDGVVVAAQCRSHIAFKLTN
jgi:TonB family protein